MKIPDYIAPEITIALDFEQWRKVYNSAKGDALHKRIDRYENAISKLSGVIETCFNHQCWLRYEWKARTWEGLDAEVKRLMAKVERTTARYSKPSG